MKIYTKTGDLGETSLLGGTRIKKSALQVETYGTIDELNATLGVVLSFNEDPEIEKLLQKIQKELFSMGGELASTKSVGEKIKNSFVFIQQEDIEEQEKWMDKLNEELPPLQNFILPGGSQCASFLQLARSVCRRGERLVVALDQLENLRPEVLQYLNRLSDLLFVLSRVANFRQGTKEVEWKSH